MRKQLLTYDAYKDKTLEELFAPELLAKSLTLQANVLASKLWLNEGQNTFKTINLPVDVQMSPIFSITTFDHPAFAYPLLIFGGNQSKVKPEMGSQMGSFGGVLMTDDGQNWKSLSLEKSAFYAPGETRDIVTINSTSGRRLLVFRNNDEVLEFEIEK